MPLEMRQGEITRNPDGSMGIDYWIDFPPDEGILIKVKGRTVYELPPIGKRKSRVELAVSLFCWLCFIITSDICIFWASVHWYGRNALPCAIIGMVSWMVGWILCGMVLHWVGKIRPSLETDQPTRYNYFRQVTVNPSY